MIVLHILNDIEKLGNGIINVAVDLACLQAQAGLKVGIASAGGEYENLLADYGVKHFNLDQTRKPLNLLKAARNYRRIIQEFQPNIVHAHMMTGMVLARVLKGEKRYGLVSTVHNEFQRSAILMGWADRVIAVSNAVAESMMRRGVAENKLRVVSNGAIGSPRNRPLSDYQPMPIQRPAIATIAGMYQRKGIADLIAAFEKIARDFPAVHLYIVGNGPDRPNFEAQARSTSVAERIHFEGFQAEPQKYLLSTDIFVLASRRDPNPLVISEARQAGCAIVATNVDGIPEALEGGSAGVLVPPADSAALATTISQLLVHPQELQSWKEKAKNNLEWLNVARVNHETLAVYREL